MYILLYILAYLGSYITLVNLLYYFLNNLIICILKCTTKWEWINRMNLIICKKVMNAGNENQIENIPTNFISFVYRK